MKPIAPLLSALTLSLLTCAGAQALEPFKAYDSFAAAPLSPDRWADGERSRVIKGGALNLVQRTWPLTNADSGLTFMNFNENLVDPAPVTALKAKVTVNALEVSTCAANPAVSLSRARIIGGFFNVGSPVPGSQVGDVLAQVRIGRASNAADPAGVLRVQGIVSVCTSADCVATTLIGSVVDLGTVALGTPATVQMQWDQPNKRFRFSRDANAFSGVVAYTQTDASPPSVPFKQMSTRVDLPSCQSAARTSAFVDASFDNISVNASAAP